MDIFQGFQTFGIAIEKPAGLLGELVSCNKIFNLLFKSGLVFGDIQQNRHCKSFYSDRFRRSSRSSKHRSAAVPCHSSGMSTTVADARCFFHRIVYRDIQLCSKVERYIMSAGFLRHSLSWSREARCTIRVSDEKQLHEAAKRAGSLPI